MNIKSIAATAAVCAVSVAGAGAAVAAGQSDSATSTKSGSAQCARPGKPGGGPLADVAKAIGISASSLRSQLDDGKKLSAIAQAQGKTLDQVKAAVKATLKARLDKAVAAKRLTQAQADERLANAGQIVDDIEAGKRPSRPPGGAPGDGTAPDLGGPPPAS